jgi:ketosteroid isomerase-like protein
MAHPNEDLVREGYAAFGRGDIDALRRSFFAADVRYHVPGKSPLGGDYEGVAQVLEWLGRQFELSGGTISAEVHDVVANDEHAVRSSRSAASGRASSLRTMVSRSSTSVMAG